MSVQLCCLLWARPGRRAELSAYEDKVLPLVADHGGTVVSRVISVDDGDQDPHEVQVFRFDDQAGIDAYLADPRRTALHAERDAAIARTRLFPVHIVSGR
ncbi:DUF1330 domain-containing protein [Gordonia bronchialis]|uniref:DUF1330 domain-containing protein n=1 Tax=Gordonia bronchialis TaxID=2054 RepID=UPI00242FD1CD|nr:DUF1330 domain-containing protein [Gordonia bronchialis]